MQVTKRWWRSQVPTSQGFVIAVSSAGKGPRMVSAKVLVVALVVVCVLVGELGAQRNRARGTPRRNRNRNRGNR